MSAGFYTACERLLSATANGVYQGILVAAIAGLALRLFPRTNAATRHAVWFGVLLFVTALIPAHFLISARSRPEIPAAPVRPAYTMIPVAPALSSSGGSTVSPVANASLPDPQPVQSDPGGEPQNQLAPEIIGYGSVPDAAVAEKPWSRLTSVILKPLSWNREKSVSMPHSICLGLVAAWILLASVRGGLILRRIREVRCVKTTSSVPSHGLQAIFDRLRISLASRRNVRLRTSTVHRSALVLGFIHPVVLLPAEMDNDANEGEAEHVLRHELAHVVRRDDWGNLAQQIIQAALFFHPAVWWISAKLSLEREIACDDCVLEASGQPRAYALTLANVAIRMNHCRHLLAPGVSNNNSQLEQRITMILNTNRDRSPRLARSRLGFFTTATAILAALAIDAGPRLVLAQTAASAPATSSSGYTPPAPLPVGSTAAVSPAAFPSDDSFAPESGPRPKAPIGDDYGQPLQPPQVAPVAPMLPAIPPLAAADAFPAPAAEPVPMDVRPVAPTSPGRPPNRDMSVEERLDRIERTLRRLEARDGRRGVGAGDAVVGGGQVRLVAPGGLPRDPNFDFQYNLSLVDGKQIAAEGERIAEMGKRIAENAVSDDKFGSKDIDRMQKHLDEWKLGAPVKELQALREARDSLRRETENLERQIKRIEEDQKQQKDATRGRAAGPDETPKPEPQEK